MKRVFNELKRCWAPLGVASVFACACGSEGPGNELASGELESTGGASSTPLSTGGARTTGGSSSTGGLLATGGTSGGGSVATGGDSAKLAVVATGGAGAVDSCAKLGGSFATTTTMAYMYLAGGGQYKCTWLLYSLQDDRCVYSNSSYQASTSNLCAQLSNIRTCSFSYEQKYRVGIGDTTECTLQDDTDPNSECLATTNVTETDYFNVELWSEADLAVEQSSCVSKGGVWQ